MDSSERHGFRRRWTVANAVAELLGLGGVALLALALFGDRNAGTTAAAEIERAAAFVAAGAFEGAVVGAAQWGVLRRALPDVTARSWIGATIVGAVVAWALGMIPSTVMALRQASELRTGAGAPSSAAEPAATLVYGAAVLMGAALGAVLGSAQYRVLRGRVPHAGHWLFANAAAWAVGMPIIFGGIDAAVATGGGIRSASVIAATLLVAGAAVGAVEGDVLARMLALAPRAGATGRAPTARAALPSPSER